MSKNKRRTIADWAELYNVIFLSTDGFGFPKDTHVPFELVTREQFLAGMKNCRVVGAEAGRRYLRARRSGAAR